MYWSVFPIVLCKRLPYVKECAGKVLFADQGPVQQKAFASGHQFWTALGLALQYKRDCRTTSLRGEHANLGVRSHLTEDAMGVGRHAPFAFAARNMDDSYSIEVGDLAYIRRQQDSLDCLRGKPTLILARLIQFESEFMDVRCSISTQIVSSR